MKILITREEAEDMSVAHAEGYHADIPREGCPDCEDRMLVTYPIVKTVSDESE